MNSDPRDSIPILNKEIDGGHDLTGILSADSSCKKAEFKYESRSNQFRK